MVENSHEALGDDIDIDPFNRPCPYYPILNRLFLKRVSHHIGILLPPSIAQKTCLIDIVETLTSL